MTTYVATFVVVGARMLIFLLEDDVRFDPVTKDHYAAWRVFVLEKVAVTVVVGVRMLASLLEDDAWFHPKTTLLARKAFVPVTGEAKVVVVGVDARQYRDETVVG